ncbi:hypothetical protein TNCV_3734201 [Trichonephila clavipes]|nr:hypothetical protein TNCV_3734201 [Trichonephila clavipes]
MDPAVMYFGQVTSPTPELTPLTELPHHIVLKTLSFDRWINFLLGRSSEPPGLVPKTRQPWPRVRDQDNSAIVASKG